MELQNNPTPENINPMPQRHANNPNSKAVNFLSILIVLILIILGGGAFVAKKSLDSKDNQLRTVRAEKELVNSKLSKAQAKIDQLDSPIRKANDEKRKTDLAYFTAEIRQYKKDNRTYPSTEPTTFKKQFVDVYITPKLPNFIDPNTKQNYSLIPVAQVQTPPGITLGSMQYQWAGECAGSEFKDVTDDSKAAARVLLETGETYCLNV